MIFSLYFEKVTVVLVTALILCVTPGGSFAQENTGEIEITVRSQVDVEGKPSKGKATTNFNDARRHGKNYVLLLVEQPKSVFKLVKPVAPEAIADEVSRQLDVQGFHRVAKGEKPDIVVTVRYGRGMLPNPYYTEDGDIDDISPDSGHWADAFNPPVISITSPRIARRLAEPGARDKATKGMYERLFITVRAWKYPKSPKEKPKALWIASMSIDDPDHRDLNAFYKAMLTVGAQYFDRAMPGEDVEVNFYKPLRDGRVEVGEPVVIESPEEQK